RFVEALHRQEPTEADRAFPFNHDMEETDFMMGRLYPCEKSRNRAERGPDRRDHHLWTTTARRASRISSKGSRIVALLVESRQRRGLSHWTHHEVDANCAGTVAKLHGQTQRQSPALRRQRS